MKTLYLHIGHGKTGSTYLQSLLARNREVLIQNGVMYPIKEDTYLKALNGEVTSGNGDKLLEALRSNDDKLLGRTLQASGTNSFLYSNELLHGALSQRTLSVLVPKAKEMGWEMISILLFIRDPIEHAISCYIQRLKRSRNRQLEDINTFLEHYKVPIKSLDIVKACQFFNDDIAMQIYNYSKDKDQISSKLFTWLGVPLEALDLNARPNSCEKKEAPINRSLTLSEQEFCKALIESGIPSKFLSDALVTRLPSQKAEQPKVGRKSVEAMMKRNMNAINKLNQIVGHGSGYSTNELSKLEASGLIVDDDSQLNHQSYSLTSEQVRVITESLLLHPVPNSIQSKSDSIGQIETPEPTT